MNFQKILLSLIEILAFIFFLMFMTGIIIMGFFTNKQCRANCLEAICKDRDSLVINQQCNCTTHCENKEFINDKVYILGILLIIIGLIGLILTILLICIIKRKLSAEKKLNSKLNNKNAYGSSTQALVMVSQNENGGNSQRC